MDEKDLANAMGIRYKAALQKAKPGHSQASNSKVPYYMIWFLSSILFYRAFKFLGQRANTPINPGNILSMSSQC